MSTDTQAPAPPTTSRTAAANLARQRVAGRRAVSDLIVRWMHLLDDATLHTLAREVYAEVDERERTRARTSGDEAGGAT